MKGYDSGRAHDKFWAGLGQDLAAAPADRPELGHALRPPAGSDPQVEAGTLASTRHGLGQVLVADDDEVIRQLISVNLILEGFNVTTAVDGHDCLAKARAITPDVITMDLTMPYLDGWETAIQLRKSPATSRIKIALITARAENEHVRNRTDVVDACLIKPFDPGELIRVIRGLAGAPVQQVAGEQSRGNPAPTTSLVCPAWRHPHRLP
jgi:CheY-like chemotaxis protein